MTEEPNVFPFDDALIALLAEIDAAHRALMQQEHGALTLFAKQHDLQGSWQPAQNRREFIRRPEPQAIAPPQEINADQ